MSGTPKWREIWLLGTPRQSEISILKIFELKFLGLFRVKVYFILCFATNPMPSGLMIKNIENRDTPPLKVSWHEIFVFQNMLPINAFKKVAYLVF